MLRVAESKQAEPALRLPQAWTAVLFDCCLCLAHAPHADCFCRPCQTTPRSKGCYCISAAGLTRPVSCLQDSSVKQQQQGVYIGTIHSAKGLEWDAVWVMRTHYTNRYTGAHSDELPWAHRPPTDLPPPPIYPHPYLPHISIELAVCPNALA